MDTGYCIRSFQFFTIYGQKVYLGISWIITTEYSQVIEWNTYIYCTYHLWIFIQATYDFKLVLYSLDKMIVLHETLLLDLLYTSHVNQTISSSDVAIIHVCIYSGIRLAPINVPNSASSVGNTIFLLMTHVCHVMFYIVTCHCIL